MYFQSFQEFVEMGGHGFYVWLCYGIVLFSMLSYFFYSIQLAKSNQKELVKFYTRMDARSQASPKTQNQSGDITDDLGGK